MAKKSISADGRSVVFTGASSGLGWAGALELERVGFQVFASVRKAEDGEKLVAESAHGRVRPVIMDVTKPDQIRQAVAEVGPEPLWGLVNNAGISIPGPLECVSPDQLRLQLDTNVVGQLAVIQAFLPLLRAGRGRIVNVTSGLGRIAVPFLGAYAAAQFAKEGMSDALRRELKPFGVSVSVVQPGVIVSPIWDKLTTMAHEILAHGRPETTELYRDSFLRFLTTSEQEAKQSKTQPADFAKVVVRALTDGRPKTRYHVGIDMTAAAVLARVVPDRLLDKRFAA
ncbi:SDR family oxidoreductase [Actinocrispum wychmicini]|uniref:NADP-dependent 3-hydroxy acid dehydrogenase YdfG n=1 Tax=Actinocrispum wychmicini TaxID=1213861 RepID=A0A4R2K2J1_9PSEU|nr:SDR family oxidoreductase [Actinocrispum wychmicini]TCO60525.1 NADP-dependent 3-hydroxy acid dehydrogenase YdfG [Actinocrispum wychmicini]